MATVNILPAFTYKWAQDGTVEALEDTQWKAGWSFIGATPPSVEQFNKWGQIFDEKSNYLYSQLSTLYTLTGVTPAAATATSLRDALRATGLFQTAAPGTSDTSAATTAFVAAAILASGGKLLNTRRISATGTYTPTAGTKSVLVEIVGGGGGGSTVTTTGAAQFAAGPGGGGGGYCRSYLTTGFSGVTVTIGAGGLASAGGGASSFGALMTASGGTSGGVAGPQANTGVTISGQGTGGGATGGNLTNIPGSSGMFGIVTPASPVGGIGGASAMGLPGSYGSGTSGGQTGAGPGAGGGGASSLQGNGSNTLGGPGAAGLCIIYEFG